MRAGSPEAGSWKLCYAERLHGDSYEMNPITGLLTALGALTVVYAGGWARAVAAVRRDGGGKSPATDARFPSGFQVVVGALTNFFDTLGIGSFATTTTIFRLKQMVPDRLIPGTLNAGHTLPTVAQAFIYTSVIPVDVLTLFSMITAAVLGAWLGAGVVSNWRSARCRSAWARRCWSPRC